MLARLKIDEYYMRIAIETAKRGTCNRSIVGAILVTSDKNNIVSIGYNGAPKGMPHCTDVGCIISNNKCIRVVHAEANCLLKAQKTEGKLLYTTHFPCLNCSNLIINAGIEKIFYTYDYYDIRCVEYQIENQKNYLTIAGIEVTQITY